jgi:hypothetical protein
MTGSSEYDSRRADFSYDEDDELQEYFVYFKIQRQNQTEKMPPNGV